MALQRAYWNQRFYEDPELFGTRESRFARWTLRWVRGSRKVGPLIELGAGYGRDLRFFQKKGFAARGVDASVEAVRIGTSADQASGARPIDLTAGEALDYLKAQPTGSASVVYSNLLYNMDFTEREHLRLFQEVARVLPVGGLHCYSVRSVEDCWYGRGSPIREDTFDLRPQGGIMRFFSRSYVAFLRGRLFGKRAFTSVTEGDADFPICVLYVADVRTVGLRSTRKRPARGSPVGGLRSAQRVLRAPR